MALGREHLDPVVRVARHIEKASGLPVLAELPIVSTRKAHHELADLLTGAPNGAAAQQMRRLRASLPSAGPLGGPRRVLVSAVGDSTGKSSLALNLALAAGSNGERVLLIDGDLLERKLTQSTMSHSHHGMADVLNDRVPLVDAIMTDHSGLVAMLPAAPAGTESARITEPGVHRLLREQCRDYDLVVIDGGRLGEDNLTNIFATAVDDIVPVARRNSARKDEIADAVARLGPNASKVRGIGMIAG